MILSTERYIPTAQLVLLFSVLVFASTSVSYWLFGYSWLEQQRITQLLLAATGALVLGAQTLQCNGSRIAPPLSLLVALLIGLISALLAQYPDWALKEWAKYTALVALLLCLGTLLKEESKQKILIGVLVMVSLILTTQFFAFYLASFFTGTRSVSPYLMYPGFDNPRFYGQFQTVLIPVLHGLLFHKQWREKVFNRWLIIVVLIMQWSIVWALAGRGVTLGLLAAFLSLFLVTGFKYNRILLQAAFFVLVGYLLYFLLFFLIPEWAGLATEIPSGLRFGLSRRDILWLGSWEMIRTNPLLGVGPLHFSAVWNHVGAHPHQAILQFFAEWGVPATLMLLWVVARSMWRGMVVIRTHASALDVGIWLALLASLILAQVDGVFVMPYTEGWLALIGGLALARWRSVKPSPIVENVWPSYVLGALIMLAVFVIGKILFIDVPVLHETYKIFYEQQSIGSPPRFWDQGWIPM